MHTHRLVICCTYMHYSSVAVLFLSLIQYLFRCDQFVSCYFFLFLDYSPQREPAGISSHLFAPPLNWFRLNRGSIIGWVVKRAFVRFCLDSARRKSAWVICIQTFNICMRDPLSDGAVCEWQIYRMKLYYKFDDKKALASINFVLLLAFLAGDVRRQKIIF